MQMGQWAVFKPLLVAVSPRDEVLGVPRLAGGGSRDVRDLFPSAVASIGRGGDLDTFLAGEEKRSVSATLPSTFSPKEA